MRGALFTVVVAEVISCGSTRREIRRAGCCGVYPAEEARLLREQQLRKAGQEQLVRYDAMSHACVVWCAARAGAWPRWWWTPQPAAGKRRGCLLRGYREFALLDACQTAPSALAR